MVGCASSKTECQETRCGNGVIQRGSRVQTQWDEGKGHDMKWYVGTISAVYTDGDCSIDYDDPDKWTGGAQWVYMLPVGHPGHTHGSISTTPSTPPCASAFAAVSTAFGSAAIVRRDFRWSCADTIAWVNCIVYATLTLPS